MTVTTETLKALPIFSDLSREESALLLRTSRIRKCNRGQFLFMHGDNVAHFYVICRGAIQMFRETQEGHEVTINILIAGDSINADEVVSGQAIHRVSARAVDDVTVLEIPIAWMRKHLKDFHHLTQHLLASLADRLNNVQIEAEHLTTMNSAQIVACYLQKLCVLYNFDPRGFELPYTKTLIASRLRMEKETFSRTLQILPEHGITVSGTHVSIRDMRKAEGFACHECSVTDECGTHRILHEKLNKYTGQAG